MVKLDSFTRAYIECALWSSTDDDGEPLDSVHSIDDMADSAIEAMVADCKDFQEANAELLNVACYTDWTHPGTEESDKPKGWIRSNGYEIEQAGHDFWLTRNHHGAGFWDRGLGEIGKALTDASHAYGDCDLYLGDDGKIYVA